MWLGDISYGTDSNSDTTDSSLTAAIPSTTAPDASTNPYVSLAANLVDMLHPYKQGVPVNFSISPQTQNFMLMGGLLLGGLVVLGLLRK